MIILLKNIECFSPGFIGKKDIIIAEDKILKIMPGNSCDDNILIEQVIPCDKFFATPGFIDQHIHIIGGGGENGFTSRIPELDIKDILLAGVTTLVGVLGFDSSTRSLCNLLAKARALDEQGITTYIYTGSYAVPTVTITDNITNDLVLIDKVIGTGEIAISDHRSSHPTLTNLLKLSTETHNGGLISGKAGVVHIHVGDGKAGLEPLLEIIRNSELPLNQFVPTHVNRNEDLFRQAIEYCRNGGFIDLTAGEQAGVKISDAVKTLVDNNIDMSKVTISSDANGSIPNGGVGKIQTLYDDVISCITEKNIPAEIVFRMVTQNVANVLKISSEKGAIKEGLDADITVIDKNFKIRKLIANGKIMLNTDV